MPRDFIIETTPFTVENGLLTGIRKLAWPKLKQHYGERLEQLYTDLAAGQANELSELRRGGADAPVLQTVSRAAAAMLGTAATDLTPDAHFTDLGGDSLSALTFGNLLREIFDIDVPVGVIVSPANDLRAIARYIEGERHGSKRPTFASVHGRGRGRGARQLTSPWTNSSTPARWPPHRHCRGPAPRVRTVLLTGATGFLGRYLALEWLERMDLVDGTVIALVRAKSDEDARAPAGPNLRQRRPEAAGALPAAGRRPSQVIAGDKGEANLGLDEQTWQRLADTVDLIVDPAALVNHVLPYSELFGPNALGTAELIRIALTTHAQAVHLRVDDRGGRPDRAGEVHRGRRHPADQRDPQDQRRLRQRLRQQQVGRRGTAARGPRPVRPAGRGVPLRHDLGRHHLRGPAQRAGHVHPDDAEPGRPPASRPARSTSSTPTATGSGRTTTACRWSSSPRRSPPWAPRLGQTGAFQTYHVMNPYDDGIGLDEFVDWLIEAGHPIQRIADYGDWLQRFETALRGCPSGSASTRCCRCCTTTRSRRSRCERVDGPDRSVPRGGAGRESRPRQRHSAYLAADHRQVRQRPAGARTSVTL